MKTKEDLIFSVVALEGLLKVEGLYEDVLRIMDEYADQVKNCNIPTVIKSDCTHNQFCDKQTIDMKCKSDKGCNFKVQSDL